MSDIMMILVWVSCMVGALFFAYALSIIGEVWQRVDEYERMKGGGYTLMKSDNGDDFWVGYGNDT